MFTLTHLPQSVASAALATPCGQPPPARSDTDESRAARDEAAVAAVAALHPTDAFEALLAAQIVGAAAHARHCAGAAARPGQDPDDARRWYALSASMGRQMHAGLRVLRRMQAEREKAEA